MKIISLILAAILVLSLFGCAAKKEESSSGGKDSEDVILDTTDKEENGNNDTTDAPSDGDGDVNVNDDEDRGEADVNEDDKPADSEDGGSKDTDKVTSEPDGGDKTDGGEKDTAKDTDDKAEPDGEELIYSDGVVVEAYVATLAGYFNSDFDREKDSFDVSLLHVTALFLYTQRQRTLEFSDDKSSFSVPAETMEKTMKLLFGDGVRLSDYHSYLDADLGDTYDAENDVYSFSAYRETWGEGSYALSFDHEIIFREEGSDTASVTVTLVNVKGKERVVEYKFSKVVSDGYLYFRLEEVDKK